MENKVIHILGGAGSIGSELTRQLAEKNIVVVLDINETDMFDLVEELGLKEKRVYGFVCDIRDRQELRDVFRQLPPDLVINAAARKHVTPMENTPMEAVSVNIQGTYNVIELCKEFNVKLIHISTDKVVNAENVMGATKKVAELMVKNAHFTSVRFGNVMGSRGSVLTIWQKQIEEGRPITVTDVEMQRYMMTIEEACSLVIEVAEMENVRGKVVCLDMGPKKNILELAKEVLGKPPHNIDVIGKRPGEQVTENLMTIEEEKRAIKQANFIII